MQIEKCKMQNGEQAGVKGKERRARSVRVTLRLAMSFAEGFSKGDWEE